ncbi:MAG TPA: hypothetical protein VKE93_18450 [Candidatus Angelobacter sp.]|nr:hypothetical protein [Candidatus Angelobacter sp.]
MRQIAKGSSLLRRVSTSVLLGLAVAGLGALLEYLVQGTSPFSLGSLDDLVIGVITGLVVFAYEQRRQREVLKKISVIAAMNHHVRNALQSISYAPYAEQTRQIQLIKDSVQRIQWALKEILPGEMEESQLQENIAGPPAQSP